VWGISWHVRAYAAQITRGEVVPSIAVLEGFIEQLDEVRVTLLMFNQLNYAYTFHSSGHVLLS
jgi:hypothetical protein